MSIIDKTVEQIQEEFQKGMDDIRNKAIKIVLFWILCAVLIYCCIWYIPSTITVSLILIMGVVSWTAEIWGYTLKIWRKKVSGD